jgi:hypothetical protein
MKMKTRIRSLEWQIKMRDASYCLFPYHAAGGGVVWFDRRAGTTAKQKAKFHQKSMGWTRFHKKLPHRTHEINLLCRNQSPHLKKLMLLHPARFARTPHRCSLQMLSKIKMIEWGENRFKLFIASDLLKMGRRQLISLPGPTTIYRQPPINERWP